MPAATSLFSEASSWTSSAACSGLAGLLLVLVLVLLLLLLVLLLAVASLLTGSKLLSSMGPLLLLALTLVVDIAGRLSGNTCQGTTQHVQGP
jgi:hypothetical protein